MVRARFNSSDGWLRDSAWVVRTEDLVLLAHVRSAFSLSHETYGSPRMTHEVREQGLMAGRRRVARLMRENGLKARQPQRYRRTTDSRSYARPRPHVWPAPVRSSATRVTA